jgi:AcrR family transcriptional regulator
MSAREDPIRAQLIEARRAQILDAAAQVFAEKGFHRATTKEIAQTAGVSEGTIYNYFDSKDALLIDMMTQLIELDQLDAAMTQTRGGDIQEFFMTMFRARSDRIAQAQGLLQAVLPEIMVNPPLRERFYDQYVLRIATLLEQYVQKRIESGTLRPVDARLTVRILQGTFIGMLVLRILGDEPLRSRWNEVPVALSTLIFDGLRAPEGE